MSDSKSDGVKAIEAAMKELEDAFPGQFERGPIFEIDCSHPFERKFPLLDQRLIQASLKKGEKL